MHSIQVIKGKNIFTIIETMFGVSQASYSYHLDELTHQLKCCALRENKKVVFMPTIHTSDKEVKRIVATSNLNRTY